MSELKDYDIMDIEAMDDERLEKSESGKIQATRVYIKSEADKVIAELKEENEKLKATPEQIMKEVFDKCLIYPKEMVRLDDAYKLAVSLRKQKYKRCLAMSRFCAAECVVNQDTYKKYSTHKSDFRITHLRKWYFRWLKIAEQFKEAK